MAAVSIAVAVVAAVVAAVVVAAVVAAVGVAAVVFLLLVTERHHTYNKPSMTKMRDDHTDASQLDKLFSAITLQLLLFSLLSIANRLPIASCCY